MVVEVLDFTLINTGAQHFDGFEINRDLTNLIGVIKGESTNFDLLVYLESKL